MERGEEPINWLNLCRHLSESYINEAVNLAEDWLHQGSLDPNCLANDSTGRSTILAGAPASMQSLFSPVPSAGGPDPTAEAGECVLTPVLPPSNPTQRQCRIDGSGISSPSQCPSDPRTTAGGKTPVGIFLGGSQDNSVKAACKLSSSGTEAPLGVAQAVLPRHRPLKRKQSL